MGWRMRSMSVWAIDRELGSKKTIKTQHTNKTTRKNKIRMTIQPEIVSNKFHLVMAERLPSLEKDNRAKNSSIFIPIIPEQRLLCKCKFKGSLGYIADHSSHLNICF